MTTAAPTCDPAGGHQDALVLLLSPVAEEGRPLTGTALNGESEIGSRRIKPGMKEREETRRPRSALRGWLPNTAKVSGGCKAADKREKRATRRGRVYVASLGPFRYSSGSTALGRWRVRRSAGCLPISASSIYSKHTEVEVEVDIAPRSACVLGGGNRV